MLRAAAVKAELSDTERLRYKMDEKNHDIVELKKTVKLRYAYICLMNVPVSMVASLQAQQLSEAAVKIGLLQKKVENPGSEV